MRKDYIVGLIALMLAGSIAAYPAVAAVVESEPVSCIDRIVAGLELARKPDYDFVRDEVPFRERLERAPACVKDGRSLPNSTYPPPDDKIQGPRPEVTR